MFYSQSLLSRKGPLGNIWVAAHCYKRLRREQVTGTNISSTVDTIIPDVELSYRVLAHLLLGVVRIFSKKVDYLFHDCNDVLIKLGKIFLTVHKNTSNRAKGEHRRKAFPPKEGTHGKSLSVALGEEDFHGSSEVIRIAHHDTTFTLPKTFELDCFDLEVADEDENLRTHDHFRLEVEDEFEKVAYMNKRLDDEMIARSDFYSGCFTPVEARCDFYSSCFTPVEEYVWETLLLKDLFSDGEWQHTSAPKENQKLEGGPPHFDGGKRSCARRSLILDVHPQVSDDREEPNELQLAEVSYKSPPAEGYAEFHTPVKDILVRRSTSPEIGVSTPAIKERQRISRKRKCLFDDTIVLSNQILRQWIRNSSGLVGKRRKAPHASLDVWKVQKIMNIRTSLMEPLIPSVVFYLKSAFMETGYVPSAHRQPATPARKSDLGKSEAITEQEPPVEALPTASSVDVPSAGRADEEILGEPFRTENFESEISLEDIEFSYAEGETDNQGTEALIILSILRLICILSVARYLSRCFEQEGGVLSTSRILEGKRRTRCAQVFYETLVLKSRGCIDAKQESPYGDITLSATPALKAIFKSSGV
ncbi:unnamed protein product [Spirodela intermedia]|uniref:Uncharacterized protein n=1 Tax=Spirodela intermedia TaxID=51605 RepID=A0A7I8J1F2_SPIIN|nr:unnamed protein product [Spirodela intermedia]CAA6663967.1 unnamed protein product [Spirodela intermedia]